jgi:hypothetical protein
MTEKDMSRREFLEKTGVGAIGVTVLPQILLAQGANVGNAPEVDRKRLIAALGDTIIPTAPGNPGYQHLEQYGITEEVLKALPGISQQDLNVFNASAGGFFNGKAFLDLNADQRTEFLSLIVASFPPGTYSDSGSAGEGKASAAGVLASKLDASIVPTLQKVFRTTRTRVLITFYRNFPEDKVARDKSGLPILPPGDQHQIINPNTKQLITGWDVANFPGPLSWEEEEARRAKWMKIRWFND